MISGESPQISSGGNGDTPSVFYPNRELLQPDVRAPVPLMENSRAAFQTVLLQLLCVHQVDKDLVERAASTGSALLAGCQDIVIHSHKLLDCQSAEELRRTCKSLLYACREISGNYEGLYILLQASDDLPRQEAQDYDSPAQISRLKSLDGLLDSFFNSPPCPIGMELELLGRLQIHLDELYDGACRQLERFYHAVTRAASPYLLGVFCREFYRDATQHLLPDIIIAEDEEERDEEDPSTGLLTLLPELEKTLS